MISYAQWQEMTGQRFFDTKAEWVRLAGLCGLHVHIESCWKGPGTGLFVVSKVGERGDMIPVPDEEMVEWRKVMREFSTVTAIYTTVSVG